jgi:alpha-beta hydrolase superfamily lysophospholipase
MSMNVNVRGGTMDLKDGGLANQSWRQLFTPEEVEEILTTSTHTTVTSGNLPIHVRVYERSHSAPTVVMAHGIICYGLLLSRMALPFYRAGFTVAQFDLPGLGLSGGPRGGCTVNDFIQAWRDTIAFARDRYTGPIFAMGNAEEGVTCYYAAANHPDIRAISVHNLFEYGDPRGAKPIGSPALVRIKTVGAAIAAMLTPTLTIPGKRAFPWNDVFYGSPEDEQYVRYVANDPLGLQRVTAKMGYSLIKKYPPRVRFEDCQTPVQVIPSSHNRIWDCDMVVEYYERLGGPKELIILEGKPQWQVSREFHDVYCGHVIEWFKANGAFGTTEPATTGER